MRVERFFPSSCWRRQSEFAVDAIPEEGRPKRTSCLKARAVSRASTPPQGQAPRPAEIGGSMPSSLKTVVSVSALLSLAACGGGHGGGGGPTTGSGSSGPIVAAAPADK